MSIIRKIRLLLEYNTYLIWLYNEDDAIIDNAHPPEWDDDQQRTDAFMAVSDFFDTFFIDNKRKFRFVGSSVESDSDKLQALVDRAVDSLYEKNNGKYIIRNDIRVDLIND